MMFMKSAFVKYFANSKSVAAFLANDESLATALFKLLVTIEELLVLAPKTLLHRDLIYKVKAAMVITTVRADKEIITEEITTIIRIASRSRLSNRK